MAHNYYAVHYRSGGANIAYARDCEQILVVIETLTKAGAEVVEVTHRGKTVLTLAEIKALTAAA